MPKEPKFREPVFGAPATNKRLDDSDREFLREEVFPALGSDRFSDICDCCDNAIGVYHRLEYAKQKALSEDRSNGRGEKRHLAESMADNCFDIAEKLWQSNAIGLDYRKAAEELGHDALSLSDLSIQLYKAAEAFQGAAHRVRMRTYRGRFKTPRVQVASELAFDFARVVGTEPTFTRGSRETDTGASAYLLLVKLTFDKCEGASLPLSVVENHAWRGFEDYKAGFTFQNVFDHEI